MCGIAGWVNIKENISENKKVIEEMTNTLIKRGPDNFGYYTSYNVQLGHRRLIIIDPKGGLQPMIKIIGNNKYIIVYNGELYNTEEVRTKLKLKGHKFKSYSDTEVLLHSYIEWNEECVNHINGIFSFGIWNEKEKSLFLARDHLGVKPLFYSYKDDNLLFASEIKAILKHPTIKPIVNSEGLLEIFGLGPARSLGNGVFKEIKEVPPAHYLIYKNNKIKIKEYWKVKAEFHTDNYETTKEYVRALLIDAIQRQLISDVPVCTFLSGGLDSSIISEVAAKYFKNKNKGILNTFSIDYEDNEKYFKANDFQPTSDTMWAEIMAKYIGSNHTNVNLNNIDLVDFLEEAVLANDLPGMADIDSSLLLFAREVRKNAIVGLSGECADEIFGGYPWYRNKEMINADTFPWSMHLQERRSILSSGLKKLPIEEYVNQKYLDTIRQVPKLKGESKEEHRMREMFYLNIKWFMITLLNRKDRMTMANSLEVRVPFADYRIVEYGFNIPMNMKYYNGREKGLLREAFRGLLPDEIIDRKKSPYPKTHNPAYTNAVQNIMREILNDKSSPILNLIDYKTVKELVETGGKSYKKPWFGQLMTGPQLIAYLIQINTWLKKYNINIEI